MRARSVRAGGRVRAAVCGQCVGRRWERGQQRQQVEGKGPWKAGVPPAGHGQRGAHLEGDGGGGLSSAASRHHSAQWCPQRPVGGVVQAPLTQTWLVEQQHGDLAVPDNRLGTPPPVQQLYVDLHGRGGAAQDASTRAELHSCSSTAQPWRGCGSRQAGIFGWQRSMCAAGGSRSDAPGQLAPNVGAGSGPALRRAALQREWAGGGGGGKRERTRSEAMQQAAAQQHR